ncbi:hypothetical protein [Herbidospora cretacea]|uniref:hypothetical protein n=1 Tax=Herbidospora cretacea TaxID=28444 RepID=UPI000A889797|nr:hypothetical protein [Herbidospora cretacea]
MIVDDAVNLISLGRSAPTMACGSGGGSSVSLASLSDSQWWTCLADVPARQAKVVSLLVLRGIRRGEPWN